MQSVVLPEVQVFVDNLYNGTSSHKAALCHLVALSVLSRDVCREKLRLTVESVVYYWY